MDDTSGRDFILTLPDLMQLETEQIIPRFIEIINTSPAGIQARRAISGETVPQRSAVEIATPTASFGWLIINNGGENVSADIWQNLHTAAALLGAILENRRNGQPRSGMDPALENILLRPVLESSPAAILVVDRARDIVYANQVAEELLGLERSLEDKGFRKPTWSVLGENGEQVDPERAAVMRIFDDGEVINGEIYTIVWPDGRSAKMVVNASPLHNGGGEVEFVVMSIADVTRHHRAEQALQESEERYALAATGSNDGIWDWDIRTNQVYYSPRWAAIIGERPGQPGDQIADWYNRIHPADYWQFKADIGAHLQGVTPHLENEHRLLHKDGRYRWVLARGIAVRDANGIPYRMAGSLTDINRQKSVENQLRHDAMHDTLTHLPNRAFFIDQVRRCIERARRNVDYHGAVLYLDLDRFKLVNETLGHASGDQLLVAIARRLQTIVRPRDVISRFGGDEFAILLDDITGVGDAIRTTQRIKEELAFPFNIQGHELFPNASIGIAMISTTSIRAEDVLRDADTAMYRAKAGGRGRHEVFGTEMHDMNVALFEMEAELRSAVENNQFQLYYQPIVSLLDGSMTAVEALIRWHHPRRGLILPGEFIILAEETGLIIPIGEWVLRTACRQLRTWRDAGFSNLRVSVNISARQMQDHSLPKLVQEVLQETNLEPDALSLEITEWAAMQDMDLTVEILQTLRDMGVQISIDDFGTSYSSLGYIKRFPVSTIKIDQSFVRDMTENLDDAAITRAIITMGNVLGLNVVAEGVEMEQQLAMLAPQKCDEVQGDLLGRPVPGEDITSLLREGHTLLPEIKA